MEAQFVLAGITASSTQFYHVLAALPADAVSKEFVDIKFKEIHGSQMCSG